MLKYNHLECNLNMAIIMNRERSDSSPKKRVLIAEDDEYSQLVVQEFLERLNYQVVITANGQLALDQLAIEEFDLVILDIQMPVLDGFATAKAIRDPASKVKNHNIPIIALSANLTHKAIKKSKQVGMDEYVNKPIMFDRLKKVLAQVEMRHSNSPNPKLMEETKSDDEGITGEVFNHDIFLRRYFNDQEFCQKLVLSFVQKAPEKLDLIHKSLPIEDYETMQRVLHNLKTMGGNMKAQRFAQLAKKMESGAISKNIDTVKNLLVELEAEFKTLTDILNNHYSLEPTLPAVNKGETT